MSQSREGPNKGRPAPAVPAPEKHEPTPAPIPTFQLGVPADRRPHAVAGEEIPPFPLDGDAAPTSGGISIDIFDLGDEVPVPAQGDVPLESSRTELPSDLRPQFVPEPAFRSRPPAMVAAPAKEHSRFVIPVIVVVTLLSAGAAGFLFLSSDDGGVQLRGAPVPVRRLAAKKATPAPLPVKAAKADAGVVPAVVAAPAGHLAIRSEPAGATVWVDGEERGQTPVDLEVEKGPHKVALVKAGFRIQRGKPESGTVFDVKLDPVPEPKDAAAGIKIRCETEGKYLVLVDGEETGLLCPTERIGVTKGEHQVSLYLPAEDRLEAVTIDVQDTRGSVRVRFKN